MALSTTAEIKGILGITASTYDTQIGNLIGPTQYALETMVGTEFDATSRTEYYDGGGQDRIVVAHPPIAPSPATVVVYDDCSRAFAAGSIVVASVLSINYQAGVIRIDSAGLSDNWASWGDYGVFQDGNQNVKVVYTGPSWAANKLSGMKLVLAEMIQYGLNRLASAGLTGETIGSYSYSAPQIEGAHLSYGAREIIAQWKQMSGLR